MGDPPTKEELAALGVEITDPAPEAAEPERVAFEEVDTLPDEPKSDVKIRLETGEVFRERLQRVDDGQGFNFSISNALLAADDSVAKADDGSLRIVPREVSHEFRIEGVDMGRMTMEQVAAALLHAREVAAAKAQSYFKGMDLGMAIFGERLVPEPVAPPAPSVPSGDPSHEIPPQP
jgi:hypothetical protein